MPEKDRFERSSGIGWCATYQYGKNRTATSEEINDKLDKAWAKCLRHNEGVPGFQSILNVVAVPLEHVFPAGLEECIEYLVPRIV